MDQANLDGKRLAEPRKPESPKALSPIRCYGLSVLGVALALGVALLLQPFQFRDVEVPLLLLAVAMAAWYGGLRAAIVAWALACIGFDYFFAEPLYTIENRFRLRTSLINAEWLRQIRAGRRPSLAR